MFAVCVCSSGTFSQSALGSSSPNRQKDDQYSALSAVEAARRYRRQTSTLSGTAIAAPMQNPNQLIEEHHNGSI